VLEKAEILVLNADGRSIKERVQVLFNPSEYTLSKSNEFANINAAGQSSPLLQFTRGGLQTMTMDLFFDSYEEGRDVRNYTSKITDLMNIDSELHAPPVLKFIWGRLSFTCVMSQISKKFTMFLSNGVPVRANLSVTFSEYSTGTEERATPLHSPDKTRVYRTKDGDSLWAIAAEAYGDASFWRHVADANRSIKNPRTLKPGQLLTIPSLEK
jgi:nucleoid-associated protein YgaU